MKWEKNFGNFGLIFIWFLFNLEIYLVCIIATHKLKSFKILPVNFVIVICIWLMLLIAKHIWYKKVVVRSYLSKKQYEKKLLIDCSMVIDVVNFFLSSIQNNTNNDKALIMQKNYKWTRIAGNWVTVQVALSVPTITFKKWRKKNVFFFKLLSIFSTGVIKEMNKKLEIQNNRQSC